ncbi:MAG: hypothetical protein QXK89_10255 [Candidatus Bathyarchaeia archaeon]
MSYNEVFHVRLFQKLMEDIREAARSLNESPSEFVRRATVERIEKIKGRLEYSQLIRENKIKEIFKMLNEGKSRFKIAELIGDPDLIDECYKRWVNWRRESQIEDVEKRRLRYENEFFKLMVCETILEGKSLYGYAGFVHSILITCEKSGALPFGDSWLLG